MELNDFTLTVLKNFSDIQPNIYINKDTKEITTLSQSRNIMAKATLDQEFPTDVLVYDLGEFLSVLKLMDKPELTFDKKFVTIKDGGGKSGIKYFFSEENVLTYPKKVIEMPETELEFELTEAVLGKIRQAASSLGHETFTATKVDGNIRLTVEDIEDNTCNRYFVDVPGQCAAADFRFVFNVDYIKVIPGDYDVKVSSKLISQFTNENANLTYWVAVHKSSEYNG